MIVNNIKRLMEKLKLNQKTFAEPLGISQSSLSQVLSKKIGTSALLITGICKTYNVNRDWLLTGKGNMFIDEAASMVKESQAGYYHYDASICKVHPICQEICKLCQETPDDLKQEILEYIQFKQSLKPKRSITGAKRGRRSA